MEILTTRHCVACKRIALRVFYSEELGTIHFTLPSMTVIQQLEFKKGQIAIYIVCGDCGGVMRFWFQGDGRPLEG